MISLTDAEDQLEIPPTRSKSYAGWQSGLLIGASSCLLVFTINLGVTIWSTTLPQGHPDEKHIRRILIEGPCSEMRRYNTILHLVVNIFSSILLAASNYGMQCLSAPTRADVDKAHFRGKWMDIGIPSIGNLFAIPRKRVVLWALLLLSSVPLHFFYNSVIFSSLSAVDYIVATTQKFQDLKDLWNSAREKRLENLTVSECMHKYAVVFQTQRSHVLLVGEPGSGPNRQGILSLSTFVSFYHLGYRWICYSLSDYPCRSMLPDLKKHSDNWKPYGTRIKYCLSKPKTEHCRLNFSPPLVSIIIICNAIKAAVLLYTAFRPPTEPLLVLGDAIESYLTTPDPFSANECLISANNIILRDKKNSTGPRKWVPVQRLWASAVTMRRWKMSILLYSAAVASMLVCLVVGIRALQPNDFKTLWNLGFGAVTELTLIGLSDGNGFQANATIVLVVLLANLPQFIFSILYFQYNALFTGMLAAKEWSNFGYKRKGLRVSSDPKRYQRSRYFLQLPYRWGIPLILMSILIHWMLSQSLFVVAIENLDDPTLYSTCGYSPIAIIAVTLASGVLLSVIIITGFRRLPSTIPVVGSCSLAIAAACHHPTGLPQPEEPFLPLKWGVIVMGSNGEAIDTGTVGHCGFSSNYVEEPQAGAQYA
ncbi:hypothetical protein BGZ63DRAFT_347217 [Mariannaea sp. PMI_226]|nr:hypothetical protein BGZ63DRAFT_347217 [Mariannaea sp. PMI_226]